MELLPSCNMKVHESKLNPSLLVMVTHIWLLNELPQTLFEVRGCFVFKLRTMKRKRHAN